MAVTRLGCFLGTTGGNSGVILHNADYDGTSTPIYTAPGSGVLYEIKRMIITLGDNAVVDGDGYGAISAGLTNGITMKITESDGSTLVENLGATNVQPIKNNIQWASLCFDFAQHNASGAGNDFGGYRWTFTKGASSILLHTQRQLQIILNDDFSSMTDHQFFVEGSSRTYAPSRGVPVAF